MNESVVTRIPCNLCQGYDASVIARRSRSGRPLRTVACHACGLVWSDPRPHEARRFYAEDYRLAYKNSFRPKPKHVLRAGKVALSRLGKIHSHVRPGLQVLDVGSGGGEFAYLLATLGLAVKGIEPNRGYAGYAAEEYGLDVEQGFIGDAVLPPASYDLITIWHVLEHTENPRAVLAQLRDALKPGGTLVVEVPNVEATCQSPRSTFHEAHLYNFNIATLQALAAASGLQAVEHKLSADGGNLTAVYRSPAADVPIPMLPTRRIAGNFRRVSGVVQRHTPWRHALSLRGAGRTWRRLGNAVAEQFQLRRLGGSGRALLDALYLHAADEVPVVRPAAAAAKPLWPWVAAAYALGIALEEIIVDGLPASQGWSEGSALALFWGLQGVVLVGLLWRARGRLTSLASVLRAGSWAAPLLAIPAFC